MVTVRGKFVGLQSRPLQLEPDFVLVELHSLSLVGVE